MDAVLKHEIRPLINLLEGLSAISLSLTFVIEPAVAPIPVMEDKRD